MIVVFVYTINDHFESPDVVINIDTIISIYHKNFYWTLMVELHYGWIEITELVSNQFVTQVNKIRAHEDIRKLELNDE